MIRYLIVLLSCAVLLGGCATTPDVNRLRLQSLPQHYSQFDVDLSWEVKSAGGETFIDGELKSIRYQFMEDIEIWVAVLDATGKTVGRSVSYLIPYEVKQGDIVPFSLRLPVAAQPGTKLRFTYKYVASDGGDDKGDSRTQSFESVVPGVR